MKTEIVSAKIKTNNQTKPRAICPAQSLFLDVRICRRMMRRLGVFIIWTGIAALFALTLVFLSASLGGTCFDAGEMIVCYWRK